MFTEIKEIHKEWIKLICFAIIYTMNVQDFKNTSFHK